MWIVAVAAGWTRTVRVLVVDSVREIRTTCQMEKAIATIRWLSSTVVLVAIRIRALWASRVSWAKSSGTNHHIRRVRTLFWCRPPEVITATAIWARNLPHTTTSRITRIHFHEKYFNGILCCSLIFFLINSQQTFRIHFFRCYDCRPSGLDDDARLSNNWFQCFILVAVVAVTFVVPFGTTNTTTNITIIAVS